MAKKGKKKSKKLELHGTKQAKHPEELASAAEILSSVLVRLLETVLEVDKEIPKS